MRRRMSSKLIFPEEAALSDSESPKKLSWNGTGQRWTSRQKQRGWNECRHRADDSQVERVCGHTGVVPQCQCNLWLSVVRLSESDFTSHGSSGSELTQEEWCLLSVGGAAASPSVTPSSLSQKVQAFFDELWGSGVPGSH